jgi:hypothetical protein
MNPGGTIWDTNETATVIGNAPLPTNQNGTGSKQAPLVVLPAPGRWYPKWAKDNLRAAGIETAPDGYRSAEKEIKPKIEMSRNYSPISSGPLKRLRGNGCRCRGRGLLFRFFLFQALHVTAPPFERWKFKSPTVDSRGKVGDADARVDDGPFPLSDREGALRSIHSLPTPRTPESGVVEVVRMEGMAEEIVILPRTGPRVGTHNPILPNPL